MIYISEVMIDIHLYDINIFMIPLTLLLQGNII